jgi:hypothetical protein
MNTKLYIVTVATHDDFYLPYLKKTCEINNSELIILGYGEKWKGFNWKYQLVSKFLKKLNNDDIVCFVDGFDVICTRDLKDFKKVFVELKNKYNFKLIVSEHKIVNNNDINSYFYYFLLKIYFFECKNKSLNAGTYAGYVKDLIEILENINNLNNNSKADDQILLTKYCNSNSNNIYIDTKGELFLTLENPYKNIDHLFKFKNNNIYYNGYQPFFIHGPGETYLDNILIKMNINYDYNNKVNEKLFKNFYNKLLFRINNGLPYFLFVLFVIILILFLIAYFINKNLKKFKKQKIKK